MNDGIGCCGSIRLLQRDTPAGPTSTTPTSVMRCSLVEPPVVSRSTKTIGTSRAGSGKNCSDMEIGTLDAWLCGKYAPVDGRTPSSHGIAREGGCPHGAPLNHAFAVREPFDGTVPRCHFRSTVNHTR